MPNLLEEANKNDDKEIGTGSKDKKGPEGGGGTIASRFCDDHKRCRSETTVLIAMEIAQMFSLKNAWKSDQPLPIEPPIIFK